MPDIALHDFSLPDLELGDIRGRGEDEQLFARDDDDILIRREKENRSRFEETVRMVIDGYVLDKVPRAVPKADSQGNAQRDTDGGLIPRTTTIYDAAMMLVRDGRWTDDDLKQRLPILCHQPHMSPVGVCRMCSVHVSTFKRGKLTAARKLVPSCQHRVEDGMIVTTRLGAERFDPARAALAGLAGGTRDAAGLTGMAKTAADLIDQEAKKAKEEFDGAFRNSAEINRCVTLLAELLAADHLRPALVPASRENPVRDGRYENELDAVARTFGIAGPRAGMPVPADGTGRNDRAAKPTDPRSRRLALPIAGTDVDPEELDDRKARTAWFDWNKRIDEQFPYSSRTVVVDHDRCILCDRCARACSEVKPFKVIGHTGKGYAARISFDLDQLMGESSCVQCGECMTQCPTGALSLRRRVQPRNWEDSPKQIAQNPNTPFPKGSDFLTADEMRAVRLVYKSPRRKRPQEIHPFRTVPYAYLKWNEGSVRRITIPPGQTRLLCRQGEYGSTAFLLTGTGKFHVHVGGGGAAAKPVGFLGRMFGGAAKDDLGPRVATRAGDDLIFGEMACLTHKPRTASVVAEADPVAPMVVYEVTRNVLDMMQRTPSARDNLQEVYTARAIQDVLTSGNLLKGIADDERKRVIDFLLSRMPDPSPVSVSPLVSVSDIGFDPWDEVFWSDPRLAGIPDDLRRKVIAFLRPLAPQTAAPVRTYASIAIKLPKVDDRLEFRRLAPGEVVVAEGDTGKDFYLVRLGFLKVFRTTAGRERVFALRTDRDYFGETALLGDDLVAAGVLAEADNAGRRTASVAAVDPSEVIRIPGDLFEELCKKFPAVRDRLLAEAVARFRSVSGPAGFPPEYVAQGIYMGQKMLALDLVSCTRCDECTKACADSHDGHSRLIREGLRFGDFLVATSCRSCHKPYCMEGCPVDAIHRRGNHLEVVIEDHCIGCSLCERNCPYGAIQMVPRKAGATGSRTAAVPRQAVNCDLCGGHEPYCVDACPHEAAIRLDGKQLLAEVSARAARTGVGV